MNRRPWTAVVILAVLVCALLACKRKESQAGSGSGSGSLSERAAKLKPDAKKRLDQLAALAPKVKAEPAVTSDRPVATKPSRKSVAIIGEQWLTDPNRNATGDETRFENTLLSLCKHGTEGEPDNEDDIEYLEECVAIETVAVIRERSLVRPKIKMKSESYDSGKLEVDALIYDLATGKLLGAYDIRVWSDPELKLPGAEQTEEDWMSIAMSDLETNAETKVEEKLGINL